ncbi:MAG: site-specific integrase [Candidatus Thermoplasmatota archaeon]|nr:site-specific integrase [Candidatus Thermoplasmatota archaeon]
MRLRPKDFQTGKAFNTISILGKGRYGGKLRTIDWHPDTPAELEAYLDLRDSMVMRARGKNQNVEMPEDFLIYERDGKLYPYSESGVDSIIGRLSERTHIEFMNHDLRRTCGRMMYRAGVRIGQIARIFGHSDIRTTMKYLGLDHEDMAEAMSQYAQYQKAVVFPKVERIEHEPDGESGPNRI